MMIVNQKMILYNSMSFLFSRIVPFPSFLSMGLGICCSMESMKAKSQENIVRLPLLEFLAFLLLGIPSVESAHIALSYLIFNLLHMSTNVALLIQSKEKANSECVSYKDDSTPKSLKPVLISILKMSSYSTKVSLSPFLLLDNCLISCFSYFFVISLS
jgi:hypothetical protein